MPESDPQLPLSNAPEITVGELARRLKRTLEDAYGFVRVRGELGRVTVAKSGHVYADLKDADTVLQTVMWKGTAQTLRFRPEEGLEVVCEGRVSTYPGRSSYQLIVERMAIAGQGALLAQIEERRKRLAAEGLFAAERKKPIPLLPAVIGVVTSPTGAVIRDILHRLTDRFPVRVLVWPVVVQGERAAQEVAAAVAGFDAIVPGGPVPRPDVVIVARGGGSVEDLMAFNEEIVVRAVAACTLPVISAIGHETDTTLIDHAADLRAPTPTGAAEQAVPVRMDLIAQVDALAGRLARATATRHEARQNLLRAVAARLPGVDALLAQRAQRFDRLAASLEMALVNATNRAGTRLGMVATRLQPATLVSSLARRTDRADTLGQRAQAALGARVAALGGRVEALGARLRADRLSELAGRAGERTQQAQLRLMRAQTVLLERRGARLEAAGRLLETLSHRSALARGFAMVLDAEGRLVREGAALEAGQRVTLRLVDGDRRARIDE
jgi:exodeoxyribonuclease VII large subunit